MLQCQIHVSIDFLFIVKYKIQSLKWHLEHGCSINTCEEMNEQMMSEAFTRNHSHVYLQIGNDHQMYHVNLSKSFKHCTLVLIHCKNYFNWLNHPENKMDINSVTSTGSFQILFVLPTILTCYTLRSTLVG